MHLVPTLINIANFPSFADAAGKFPTYAKHMRDLHARNARHGRVRGGGRASRCTPAPTPAASSSTAGWPTRCSAMGELLGARQALFAAVAQRPASGCGCRSTTSAAPADLIVYADDPVEDLGVLQHPSRWSSGRAKVVRGRRLTPV